MKRPIINRLLPIPRNSGFRQEGYFAWCASMIRVDDTYHLFASRWPEANADRTSAMTVLDGYRQHSEIVRATADNPMGPYEFQEVALAGRGEGYWDGQGCHGPKIVKFGDRFVLYYQAIAWGGRLRKIGYAWSDDIESPWHRCDSEIPLTEDANNPAPYVHPDGSILLAYRDERLRVYVARADSYDGQYETIAENIFPAGRLEDPDLFFCDGKYHMVMEDNEGVLTGSIRHGGHLVSADGIHWEAHDPPKIYTHTLEWADGTSLTATRRERPDLFNDNEGVKGNGDPTHLITGVLAGGLLELLGLWAAHASATGLSEQTGQTADIDLGQVFGRGKLGEDLAAGCPENIREMLAVFGKDQVQKRDETLLFGHGGLGALEAKPRQVAQALDIFFGNRRDFGILLTEDPGDEEGIDGIGLRAANGDVASRSGHDRIDDVDGVTGLGETLEEDHPVMAGGLHADEDSLGRLTRRGQAIQEAVETLAAMGERDVSEHSFAVSIEQGGVVTTFRHIDTQRPHEQTSLRTRTWRLPDVGVTPDGTTSQPDQGSKSRQAVSASCWRRRSFKGDGAPRRDEPIPSSLADPTIAADGRRSKSVASRPTTVVGPPAFGRSR